jgi:acetylornithine deacetylase/succinyl-diaminopimelate desuccinylase-like protein
VRSRVDTVFADQRIQRAFRFISEHESDIEADQVRLTNIAAPPFGEGDRARQFHAELASLGLEPMTDSIGNVIAAYEFVGRNPVVIGAHLDTVFPGSTPLKLDRRGRILFLPGISDNGAGIVALLWAVRAAKTCKLRFRRPVICIGNVGEEGEGNLRGIRHVFGAPPWDGRECDFIAVDGAGLQRITHQALGSRRYRTRLTGPGGHSWADFGRPNPVHAMATAIHTFCGSVVRRPGCSFNFGMIRGGISVNAIPREAVMEVDLRSVSARNLDELEHQFRRSVEDALRGSGLQCKMELMGERPSGTTPTTSDLVQASMEVTRRFGVEPQPDIGSTDANIPISIGIPAIAVGGGGNSGNVHTPEEWFDASHRDQGIQRLLALIAVSAGLTES